MFHRLLTGLRDNYRKFIPGLVVLVLCIIAASTNILGQGVRETVQAAFSELAAQAVPLIKNLIIGLIVFNAAWLLYSPLTRGLERLMCQSKASPRAIEVSLKLLKFFYWALTVFLLFTFAAADVLGKFVVGFGVFGAALTLSLQGVANDFLCGLMIQFSRKINEGEDISIDDGKLQGKVRSIGYLSTIIDSEAAVIHVPNREVWARAIKVLKPQPKKSLLILPPGYEPDNNKK